MSCSFFHSTSICFFCSSQHSICLPQPAVALVNLLLVVPTYCCSSQCHNGWLNLNLLLLQSTFYWFSQPTSAPVNLLLVVTTCCWFSQTPICCRNLLLLISTFWGSTDPAGGICTRPTVALLCFLFLIFHMLSTANYSSYLLNLTLNSISGLSLPHTLSSVFCYPYLKFSLNPPFHPT